MNLTFKKVHFSLSFYVDGRPKKVAGTSERRANTYTVTFQKPSSEGVLLDLKIVKLFAKDHADAVDKATERALGCEVPGVMHFSVDA